MEIVWYFSCGEIKEQDEKEEKLKSEMDKLESEKEELKRKEEELKRKEDELKSEKEELKRKEEELKRDLMQAGYNEVQDLLWISGWV